MNKISDFIKQNDLSQESMKEKLRSTNSDSYDPDIEENSGVDFPGMQFDTFLKKSWREIDRTSNSIHFVYDLVVVE